MVQNSDKCCHVEGTERASSGEYNVRSASSSWNDEKCGGWTLGCMSTASGGGETGVLLSQSEETLAHRMCYKTLPGDIFCLTLTMEARDLAVDRRITLWVQQIIYFDMAETSVRPRMQILNNLRIS